jgi:hypothetical protein
MWESEIARRLFDRRCQAITRFTPPLRQLAGETTDLIEQVLFFRFKVSQMLRATGQAFNLPFSGRCALQDMLDTAAILPLHIADQRQTIFNGIETSRVKLHGITIGADAHCQILDAVEQFSRLLSRLAQRRIEAGEFGQRIADSAEEFDGGSSRASPRLIPSIQERICCCHQFCNTRAILKQRALAQQLLLLAGAQARRANILEQERQLLDALSPALRCASQRIEFLAHLAQRCNLRRNPFTQRYQTAEPVEHLAMGATVEERQTFVLTVNIKQAATNIAQHGAAHRATVHPRNTAPALTDDLARQDHLIVVVAQAVLIEKREEIGAIGDAENPLNPRALTSRRAQTRDRFAPPRSVPSASIMIDLPAPVSPVRTLNPSQKRRLRRSIIAKSLMLSSSNMHVTALHRT